MLLCLLSKSFYPVTIEEGGLRHKQDVCRVWILIRNKASDLCAVGDLASAACSLQPEIFVTLLDCNAGKHAIFVIRKLYEIVGQLHLCTRNIITPRLEVWVVHAADIRHNSA